MGFVRVSGYSQDDIDNAKKQGASGNASPSEVLAGKTFSSNNVSNQTGTMPNNGSLSVSLGRASNTSASVAAGYYSGGTVSVSDATGSYTITTSEVNTTTYTKDLGAKHNVRYVNYSNVYTAGRNAGVSTGENNVKTYPSNYFRGSDLANSTVSVSKTATSTGSSTSDEYTCPGDGWLFAHTYNFNGSAGFKGTLLKKNGSSWDDIWHETSNKTTWVEVTKGETYKTKIEITETGTGSANTRAVFVTFKA